MSVRLAQINPTLGDFEGNLAEMLRAACGAATVFFAWGAISGWLTQAPDATFAGQAAPALDRLAQDLPDSNIITAYWNEDFQPVIFISQAGQAKHIPAPWARFEYGGANFLVCLDTPAAGVDADYCICLKPQCFLPFSLSEQPTLKLPGCTFGQVNLAGAQDNLLFAGRSYWRSAAGRLSRAKSWQADNLSLNEARDEGVLPLMADIHAGLVCGIRDYVRKNGFKSVILGLSGGIDSALVAALAVEALGAANVYALSMPSRYSSAGTQDDARQQAFNQGINFEIVPIEPLVAGFNEVMAPLMGDGPPGLEQENLQARIRCVLLMTMSNRHNHLLLATSNRSESLVGYATLYGDMSGGLAPIAGLYKTEVYLLAEHINAQRQIIPPSVIERPPSAELRPDQKDQDSLPPYPQLDALLHGLVDKGLSVAQVTGQGYDGQLVRKVEKLLTTSQYKRAQAPPGLGLRKELALPLTAKRRFLAGL